MGQICTGTSETHTCFYAFSEGIIPISFEKQGLADEGLMFNAAIRDFFTSLPYWSGLVQGSSAFFQDLK